MDRKRAISDHFVNVGGGTSLVVGYLGLIPGVIPIIALPVRTTRAS